MNTGGMSILPNDTMELLNPQLQQVCILDAKSEADFVGNYSMLQLRCANFSKSCGMNWSLEKGN